jgi:hypothetical protein
MRTIRFGFLIGKLQGGATAKTPPSALKLPSNFQTSLCSLSKLRCNILSINWLPRMDSNHDKVIQSHLCYRYTTRQCN